MQNDINVFNKDIEKAKLKQEKQIEEINKLKKLFNDLFESENGKIVLKYIFDKSNYTNPLLPMCQNNLGDTDSLKIAYLDGRRSLFIEIANMINPNLITNLMK